MGDSRTESSSAIENSIKIYLKYLKLSAIQY